MKKNNADLIKLILTIVAVVAAVAAVVTVIILYKDKITACIASIKEKLPKKNEVAFTEEEYEDFADV